MRVFVSYLPSTASAHGVDASPASSASTALAAANAFVSLGLKAVGYEYVNIDDGWSLYGLTSFN